MKRYTYAPCIMLLSMLLYTSCLGSDNSSDVIVYDDMAITGFSLATVNRYIHTTSSKGTDSIYKKTLATNPTFTIDQKKNTIYNTDSLPKDCDLKHVLATISASTYSGRIIIKSIASDTLIAYSSSDSIDFTQSREIRVYNNALQKYRTYQVTLNQHQVETGKILWEEMPADSYPDDGTAKWAQIVAAHNELGDFIGAGRKEAYAFSKDRQKIMVTKDEGTTWEPDNIDGDLSLLPKGSFAFVSYPFAPNEDTDYQLLAGASGEGETACSIWRKVAEYAEGSMASKWVNLPVEPYNKYFLPTSQALNLVYFHGEVLAIDATGIRNSRDSGITWRISDSLKLPDAGNDTFFDVKAITDSDGALWFKDIETNRVWRGVLVE